MSLQDAIGGVVEASARSIGRNEDDYEIDGILYCGNCNTPKQGIYNMPWGQVKPFVLCECLQQRKAEEEKAAKLREKMERIAKLRVNGINDENIRGWTFENADDTDLIKKAKKYYDQFEEMHENNIGLLFFGNVGTGKTYLAACIANALISDGIPVLMTNFSKVLNDLSGFKEEDKNGYINSLNNYDLLIIDDLGVERQSDFALEQVFNVIDSRYKNGQPLIVTTNLSIEDLRNPKDMKYKRIYDRILEMTIPIKVDGVSRREQIHKDKLRLAKELFAD